MFEHLPKTFGILMDDITNTCGGVLPRFLPNGSTPCPNLVTEAISEERRPSTLLYETFMKILFNTILHLYPIYFIIKFKLLPVVLDSFLFKVNIKNTGAIRKSSFFCSFLFYFFRKLTIYAFMRQS